MTFDECFDEILQASDGIPFENSSYQNDTFVIKAQLTPARAYRAILLRLTDRLNALREARYSAEKERIDIEELEDKLMSGKGSRFDDMRDRLTIAKKEADRKYSLKLVNDAIKDVEHLYGVFKKFPRFTREEFEAEERAHFAIDLTRKVNGIDGAQDALSLVDETIIRAEQLKPQKSLLDILGAEIDKTLSLTADT